jgi:hypothetical protein
MTTARPISRDPFARATLYRVAERTNAKCDWCGSNWSNSAAGQSEAAMRIMRTRDKLERDWTVAETSTK